MRTAIGVGLVAMLAAGCVQSTRQGSTRDGLPVWKIECPAAGGCDEEAQFVCNGDYVTLDDDDTYSVVTNPQTKQVIVGRRQKLLIACLPPPPEQP